MAKRVVQQGLPLSVTCSGIVGDQLTKLIEGSWGLGLRRWIIDAPPDPPPVHIQINGNHPVELLAGPNLPRGERTGKTIMMGLAETGEPFSYSDLKSAMAEAKKKGGPGNILRDAVTAGHLKRVGTGMYVGVKLAALQNLAGELDKTPAPAASITVMSMVEGILKAAYPQPALSLDIRAKMIAAGRRPGTASVALYQLRKRKLARRVGKGKWIYKPAKGAKA